MIQKETHTKAGINSLIMGIIGIICVFIPYFFIASIVLAILAIYEGDKAKKQGDTYGLIGIILGTAHIILYILMFLTTILVYSYVSNMMLI